MLFKQIKYFVSVVECNSFTEAAEQCYISQPAISQQIQALEKDLGVELIHRENRSFSLTPAGDCIDCKQCEQHCPQHIDITAHLKEISAAYDGFKGWR